MKKMILILAAAALMVAIFIAVGIRAEKNEQTTETANVSEAEAEAANEEADETDGEYIDPWDEPDLFTEENYTGDLAERLEDTYWVREDGERRVHFGPDGLFVYAGNFEDVGYEEHSYNYVIKGNLLIYFDDIVVPLSLENGVLDYGGDKFTEVTNYEWLGGDTGVSF